MSSTKRRFKTLTGTVVTLTQVRDIDKNTITGFNSKGQSFIFAKELEMGNFIGNISEDILEGICKVCLENPTEENEQLHEILTDIEFWEGGHVHIEDQDTIWVSGDNGRMQVSLELLLGVKSIQKLK